MRKSLAVRGAENKKAGRLAKGLMSGALVVAALAVTANAVSLQDVAEMTGVETREESRWLTRLVSVPSGSRHIKVDDRISGYSDYTVQHAMAVRTASATHVIDKKTVPNASGAQRINRQMQGARVWEKPVKTVTAEQVVAAMIADRPVSGDLKTVSQFESAQSTHGFRPTVPASAVIASVRPEAPLRTATAGQLDQARKAARVMASVFEKVKREHAQNDDIVISAYAPQESDIAGAFAAVLRPAVKASKSRIVLGKGDHKWAAKPLPRRAFKAAEKRCLAAGVYFEARGEKIEGQKAVAQVILNRVKNPAYPNSICGVVYQNKLKRNRCQFSFACDGIRDRINSRKHWRTAKKVADDAVSGKFWLKSVGSSSHYHADYVWPRWRRKMTKMVKIGRHIFYRTRGGGWS